MMKQSLKRTTVYFDRDLHHTLRVKSLETSRSLSDLINGAVRLSLAEDAEDMGAFEKRRKEPGVLFEKVLKDLKKRGKI